MPTLDFSNCKDDGDKRRVIERYIKTANSITHDQFLKIFEAAAGFTDNDKKKMIIYYYMGKANSITHDQFLEIFKAYLHYDSNDDFEKRMLIKTYMNKNDTNPEQFLKIFKAARFTNDDDKRISICQYMEKVNSITHEQFLEIFKAAGFADDSYKRVVIETYIDKNYTNPEQFLEIFKEAGFTHYFGKKIFINNYIGKNNTNPEQFLKIFEAASFIDEYEKIEVIKNYFSNENNQDFDKLLHILSSDQIGDLKYRVDLICNTLKKIYPDSTSQTAENLSELGNKLYPNIEHLRIELFEEAIDKKLINKDNIQFLKLDNIEDGNSLLSFLEYAQSKIQEIGELDILKLTKGRYHSRYKSLSNLLEEASPEDVFSQDGMKKIQGIFGSNINEFKALDILSYFDIKGRVKDFHSMLKKDLKKDIKDQFKPSKDQLLISEEELNKIAKLIGDESVKGEFYKVGGLCRYIKGKVDQFPGQLPVLNKDFTINFKDSIIDEEIREELNDKFKKAFDPNASNDDIVNFFSSLIDPAQQATDTFVITDTNKDKLLKFFKKSKADIYQLLQKEGGFDKFITTLSTINDGCSANIGNQFHIVLYDCLLQENSDAILYQILSQDIIPAILNKGVDLIGSQPNPLDNYHVKNYPYSPEALFDKVAELFYDPKRTEKAIGRNAADLINDKCKDDKAPEIIELLLSEDGVNFDQDAAQIAAYLTLSHSGLIPKERLQSILGSNISLNDENKKKLTKILKSPNSVIQKLMSCFPSTRSR